MEAWRHDKHRPKMEGKISEQGRREWLWNAPDRLFVEMAKLAQTSLYVYGLHIEALPGIFKWVFVSSCYDITGFYDAAVLLLVLLSLSLPMLVMVGWSSLMWGLCTTGLLQAAPSADSSSHRWCSKASPQWDLSARRFFSSLGAVPLVFSFGWEFAVGVATSSSTSSLGCGLVRNMGYLGSSAILVKPGLWL